MRKKILLLLCVLCMSIGILSNIQVADAIETDISTTSESKDDTQFVAGETLDENHVITNVDEDGNITEATDLDESGLVPEGSSRSVSIGNGVVNFNTKSSNENTIYEEDGTGRSGYTNGSYGADGAYLASSNGKIKFMQAGVVGWVAESEVQVLDYTNLAVKTVSYYSISNDRIIHHITTNLNSTSYASNLDVGPASAVPELKANTEYYSYDGHYFYAETDKSGSGYYKMLTDYRNNVRTNAVNASNPYYNYFQYLSHRSLSNYNASTINSYLSVETTDISKLRNTGSAFVENQNTYGVNALLMIGVAINESGWGTSNIAQTKNNLFGHGAYDSNPLYGANGYTSVSSSIYYHANKFISYGYLDPVSDWRYSGSHLGDKASGVNVKYASDPYWGEKAAAFAWKIDIANGNKDAFKYTIGIKDVISTSHTNVTVRNAATTSATALYTTCPGTSSAYAISNYPFIVLGGATLSNGFYKIQSDAPLTTSRSAVEMENIYSFSRDYAYIPTTNTTKIVSTGTYTGETTSDGMINYQANLQTYGWTTWVKDGATCGTTGLSKRLEGVKISLGETSYSGGVTYRVQSQTYGWMNWVSDGQLGGTADEFKRAEAIQIKLTGTVANYYDVYYRAHTAQYGWLDWTKNGETAGTVGCFLQMEALQIKLVKKGEAAPGSTSKPSVESMVAYTAHTQTYGWMSEVRDGVTAGTKGEYKRMEALTVRLVNQKYSGGIEYRSQLQTYGWESTWKTGGQITGTTGQYKRIEAIQIRLTGEMANNYDVYYRVQTEKYGWMNWTKNGESAGTQGLFLRAEGIQIVLVEKGQQAPTVSYDTAQAFIQK